MCFLGDCSLSLLLVKSSWFIASLSACSSLATHTVVRGPVAPMPPGSLLEMQTLCMGLQGKPVTEIQLSKYLFKNK